jgi:hypothetical protein
MGNRRIVLYSEPGNLHCADVRSWLLASGLEFVERQLTPAHCVRHGRVGVGLFGTPLLVAGDRVIYGFQPLKLAALLAEMGAHRPSSAFDLR